MNEQVFIDGSREIWERLAASVKAARTHGIASLEPATLRVLHEDYRRTAADLAYAQTHFAGSRTERHLNELVGLAHSELYGSAPRTIRSVWRFLSVGYPQLVRAHSREVLLAGGILFGAVALGLVLAQVNYPLARIFIPESMRDTIGDRVDSGGDIAEVAAAIAPLLTAAITANNVQVALMAFAGGMTFGAVTVYSLAVNGLLLGALGGTFALSGGSLYFWSMIVPHGSLELPAIMLAGASGLVLARALVSPGDLPRISALRAASPDAVRMVLGTLPLFVFAGIIEGFFTPAGVDPWLKIAFGGVIAMLLAAYLALAGRRVDDRAAATEDRPGA
ncbi:MAG: stage II sporulation protein M [Coriobacteriia bacterium]